MEIQKIITHGGIFHADELLAIALIFEVFGEVPVERTRTISQEDFDNPKVWVIDVGLQFDESKSNFDHHQDSSLPASCQMILFHLWGRTKYSPHLEEELDGWFRTVSEIDRNGYTDYNGFQFNSLIKAYNSLENGFELALEVGRNIIRAAIDTVQKIEESKEIWARGEDVGQITRICDAFPIHWKRYEEKMLLIYPKDEKWNLLSIDSERCPIHKTGDEHFIHQGRFIAVYGSQEEAVKAAMETEYDLFDSIN
jgi:uncharacterized UPF0160 family protein